jgi:hypothetical protein
MSLLTSLEPIQRVIQGGFKHHKNGYFATIKKEDIMKRIAFILVLITILVYYPSAGQSKEVGDIAPDFNLVDATGKEIKLGDFKGKKHVVLIFYAEHK